MRFKVVSRMVLVALSVTFVVTASCGAAWYASDEKAYLWFVDGTPEYEVKLPSTPYSYMESLWAGATHLKVTLAERGLPHIMVGQIPKTDPAMLFKSLTSQFTLSLANVQTIEDRNITTERGLTARFMALSGTGDQSFRGMIRMVAFTKDESTVYLMFVGEAKDYAGAYQQMWLKAVHSFSWA